MTVVQKVRQRLPIAILVDGINITHKGSRVIECRFVPMAASA